MMYKITLGDGTVLDKITQSGNTYLSKTELTTETFEGKLSRVLIESIPDEGETAEPPVTIIDGVLEQLTTYAFDPGTWHFLLRGKTDTEKAAETLKKTLESNSGDITDLEQAVTELYQMLIG